MKRLRTLAKILLLLVGALLVWFCIVRLTSDERALRVRGEGDFSEDWTGTIRIGAYNIAHGRGDDPGGSNWEGGNKKERAERLNAIAELIKKHQLDVLILNEVDFDCTWSHGVNQAAELAKKCGFTYRAEQRNLDLGIPFMRVAIGNAILSRFPIKEAEVLEYPPVNKWEPIVAGKKQGLMGKIALPDDSEIEVFAVHAETRDKNVRKDSVKALLEESGEPSILAGDFNSVRGGDGSTAIDLVFEDSRWQEARATDPTFPTTKPTSRIDWIFVPKSWTEISSKVIASDLSDHALIVGEWKIGFADSKHP